MELKSLQDLLVLELKDLYNAEQQILDARPIRTIRFHARPIRATVSGRGRGCPLGPPRCSRLSELRFALPHPSP